MRVATPTSRQLRRRGLFCGGAEHATQSVTHSPPGPVLYASYIIKSNAHCQYLFLKFSMIINALLPLTGSAHINFLFWLAERG